MTTTVDAVVRVALHAGGEMKLELTGVGPADACGLLGVIADALTNYAENAASEPVRVEVPQPEPPPEPVPVKAKPAKPAASNGNGKHAEAVMCDVAGCGRSFGNEHGLRLHKTKSHGKATATNLSSPEALDVDDVRMLRCNDCDYKTEHYSFSKLRTHTTIEHGRAPYPGVEDRPRAANALDLVTPA